MVMVKLSPSTSVGWLMFNKVSPLSSNTVMVLSSSTMGNSLTLLMLKLYATESSKVSPIVTSSTVTVTS